MTRAEKLAATLEDLGREHRNPRLRELAATVRRDLAGRGPDLEEHYVHAVLDMASAALEPSRAERAREKGRQFAEVYGLPGGRV